jgi:diguanylate cyclase (GGDEF)-like protein
MERLLERWRPYDSRALTARERRVEAVAGVSLAAVAVAMVLLLPSTRDFDPAVALALVVGLAVASRVRLYVGAGSAVPTQLVLVPMLFLLPPAVVPACVAAGLLAAEAVAILARRAHPERLLSSSADAWHAVAASLVFAAAGAPPPDLAYWAVLAMATIAQCATDLLTATAREWLGRGIAPVVQVRVLWTVYLIDVCLTPVGLLVAIAGGEQAFGFLLVLPLLALLAALAADRRNRIADAVGRLDELSAGHERLDRAIHRIGEAFGSKLDRAALAGIMLDTAVEALDADFGRVSLASGTIEHGDALGEAVATAEHRARQAGALRVAPYGDHVAMAQPLTGGARATTTELLVVARRGASFTQDEQALLGYLAQQTAVAMENVALHDRLHRQATVDEVTGLSNHRRFQEALRHEVTRMGRSGRPTALALIDLDHFKAINDEYGHQHGDSVLHAVAQVIAHACRATDEPARYGGDELAVILAETDIGGAGTLGENIRRAVERLALTMPDGTPTTITVSVGVSALEPGCGDPAALIEAADMALYDAKRAGRNRTRAEAAETGAAGERRFARVAAPRA